MNVKNVGGLLLMIAGSALVTIVNDIVQRNEIEAEVTKQLNERFDEETEE